MHRRTPSLAWLVAVPLAALLPLASALSPRATLAWRDTAQLQQPVFALVAPALRALRLPLWNPMEGAGQPLLAQWLHAVLHPVTLAAAWLHLGTDGWLLGLIAFAAAGAYLAARALGVSRAGAAGAAWGYALSGYLLGMTCNATYLAGAATAPWVIAGLILAAERGGAAIVLASLSVACALFSGDPQAVVTGGVIGAALATARSGWRTLPRQGAAIALGAALAAVQLLPTLSYLGTTARWAGALPGSELFFWPLDPARLVELVAPGFFVGHPSQWVAPVYRALGSPSPYPLPWAPSVFVGAALLLLAFASWRSRSGRVLLGLALLFALLALGPHLGLQQLLTGLPVWGRFRYAEKLVGPLTLCLALAAGAGVDAARSEPWLERAAMGAALALIALGLVCALAPAWTDLTLTTARAPADAGPLAREHLLEGLLHAVAGTAALAAVLRYARSRPAWLAPGLAGLLFVQSAAASPFALHVGDARAYRACPPAAIAAPAPGPRVYTALVHNVVAPEGGLDPIDRLHQKLGQLAVPSTNVACGVDSLEGYTGFETLRVAATLWDASSRKSLARRFGATHVASEPPLDGAEAASLGEATTGGVPLLLTDAIGVWRVPHREWASFAPSVRTVDDLDGAVAALRALPSPAPTEGPAIVESPPALRAAPGVVHAARRAPELVEIDAEADGDALLVVNDAWAPGWSATIDAAPAQIFPVDVLVRGIPFPAGHHRLVMRYRPREVDAGIWISLLSALGAAAWSAGRWVTARRRASAAPPPPPSGR